MSKHESKEALQLDSNPTVDPIIINHDGSVTRII
jgi:hypothetical protein